MNVSDSIIENLFINNSKYMKTYYKIIDIKNGNPYFLYHGVNGSKRITTEKWISAETKWVRDGSNQELYMSGFHVFKDLTYTMKYLKKFKKANKAIIQVQCKGIRTKSTNEHVLLVDKIKFTEVII